LKALLAQRVKGQLEDPNSEFYVEKLCDCRTKRKQGKTPPVDVAREDLDDEEEEEFAVLGALELREVEGVLENTGEDEGEDDEEHDDEEQEHREDVDLQDIKAEDELWQPIEEDNVYEPMTTEEEEDRYFDEVVERMLFG
jgi:hypothetical protein